MKEVKKVEQKNENQNIYVDNKLVIELNPREIGWSSIYLILDYIEIIGKELGANVKLEDEF